MKRKSKKVLLSLVLVLSLLFSGIAGNSSVGEAKTKPVRMKVTKKSLRIGKSFRIKIAKKRGVKIKKKKFYKTGTAVSVSKKGKVTAKKAGKATVYCRVKYTKKAKKKVYTVKLKCKVTVTSNQSAKTTPAPSARKTSDPSTSGTSTTPGTETTPTPGTETTPTPGTETTPTPGTETTPTPGAETTPTPGAETTPTPGTETTPTPGTEATPEPVRPPSQDSGEIHKDLSAFKLVHEMGLGINLGNTMEAVVWNAPNASSTADCETAWGQPITTQEMISGMKAAGFTSLRIPVSWSNMVSSDGTYTIDQRLLNRVEEIMNYAFKEDMYVIINIHWDGQWWGQFGDADNAVRQQAWDRYEAYWTQLSEYFKNYSDHLIFESANEELGERLNDNWRDTSSEEKTGVLTIEEQYQTITQINQKFVDIVRGSGGNNAERFLLMAGYDTDIAKTCDSRYILPEDTIDGHMLVSVHYYSPSLYCLSESPDNSWGYESSWGTEADVAAMKADLAKMKVRFCDQGVPVIIGEYGVCDTKISDQQPERKEGRDLFFKTICEYALNNGMCPVLWDTGSAYSRSTCKMTNSTEAANYLELKSMAERNEAYIPPAEGAPLIWSGTLKNESWNLYVPSADDSSNIILNASGCCITLGGVNWSRFENPVLTLKANDLSTSVYFKIAKTFDDSNEYWHQVADDDAFFKNTWNTSNTLTVDLSGQGLTDNQALYFSLTNTEFEGSFTIEVKEK